MNRFALLALALLAGCATQDKATPAPDSVALRPGMGFVNSIASAPASAAAGGTAGSSTKRVGVRMADYTLQYVDTRAVGLKVGERVEITSDGYLKQP